MKLCKHESDNIVEFKEEYSDKDLQKSEPLPEKKCHFPYGIPKAYIDCSFDNFNGNQKLIKDLTSLSSMAKNIVLRGNTGCGKTHLAIAISKLIPVQSHDSWMTIIPGAIFTTAPELLLKIRSSFREGAKETEEQLIDYYSGCDLLILDDLGAEKNSEFAITTLYIIIDRRIREEKQTIITTNLSQQEIDQVFGARISSRLSSMQNIKINMPDYRKNRR